MDSTDSLRAQAVRRSWACPGAGFALWGRPALAISSYAASLAAIGALAWLVVDPRSRAALWVTPVLVGVATVLWIVEQMGLKRLSSRPPRPRILVGGIVVASAVIWFAAVLLLLLLFSRFGSLKIAGSGMSPTLANGQRALYEKRVEPQRLRRGTPVLFTTSDRSAWGQPGWLVAARILAVPGDQLSTSDGKYVVNGQTGPAVSELGSYPAVILIPAAPETWTVPQGRYFVVQDSPSGGYDSRVLSWVEPNEFVSTRLYHFTAQDFLRPVE
jgi:signal peptidase I